MYVSRIMCHVCVSCGARSTAESDGKSVATSWFIVGPVGTLYDVADGIPAAIFVVQFGHCFSFIIQWVRLLRLIFLGEK